MNQDVPESRLPRRCGNCHHAVRTATLDGSIVACVARLEYHCADRIADMDLIREVEAEERQDDAAED